MKRFLDCTSSDFEKMDSRELLKSIAESEGRIMVCETIGVAQPMLGDVTNAEFVSAMGADMILLNLFDANEPVVKGMPAINPDDCIRILKKLTGRPVGVNLEPVRDAINKEEDNIWKMTEGRRASVQNVRRLTEMGADFIVLTGNPGIGVSNDEICSSLKEIRKEMGWKNLIIAGKMHGSGILSECGEKIITKRDVESFIDAGADIVLLPAPGTIPGITMEYIRELVSAAHGKGALTLTAIGTSQEGADVATIRKIALMCKMTGTDLHHLGDSGYWGMAMPENITAYSIAIRGVRHTYHIMAASIRR